MRHLAPEHAACLRLADPFELPPRYTTLFGNSSRGRHNVTSRSKRRGSRHIVAKARADADSSGLDGRLFYAVLTTHKNHATRCIAIMKTWGARLAWDHLVFYSDKAEKKLPLNVVALADSTLHSGQLYDDAQDRFTYRIMPHVASRMGVLNLSWLLWADDDTFVWPENLWHLLAPHDPRRWAWFGQACPVFRGRRYAPHICRAHTPVHPR